MGQSAIGRTSTSPLLRTAPADCSCGLLLRPGFDKLHPGIIRREFDMVAAWSVDRLGRSLQNLISFLSELKAKEVDLDLHQQSVDTSTPAGRALFQMLGVFAEFETGVCEPPGGRRELNLHRHVAVLVALGGNAPVVATKAATATIPIAFDPLRVSRGGEPSIQGV